MFSLVYFSLGVFNPNNDTYSYTSQAIKCTIQSYLLWDCVHIVELLTFSARIV